MKTPEEIDAVVAPIRNDLTSGAAELALQAIALYRNFITEQAGASAETLRAELLLLSQTLIKAHPAMAPLFHLANTVLLTCERSKSADDIRQNCVRALEEFEQRLCNSAAAIAEHCYQLIPAGDMVFAYSFSSTVVSSLLYAHNQRKFFRAVCSEARPSMEGRKLATMLAGAGMEVMHTFDSAIGLMLPNCRVALMGCDCVGRPGIVNKVGSWLLALACRELKIPLYALAGTEKFVSDERLFEFEDYSRPGEEVWANAPSGVRVLNQQFELIPFSWVSGIVTEHGILQEKDVEKYISESNVHESLRLEGVFAS